MKILEYKFTSTPFEEDVAPVFILAVEDENNVCGYGRNKVYRVEWKYMSEEFDYDAEFYFDRYGGMKLNDTRIPECLYIYCKEQSKKITSDLIEQKNAPVKKDTGISKAKKKNASSIENYTTS